MNTQNPAREPETPQATPGPWSQLIRREIARAPLLASQVATLRTALARVRDLTEGGLEGSVYLEVNTIAREALAAATQEGAR